MSKNEKCSFVLYILMINLFDAMLPSKKMLNSCYLCGQVEQLNVFRCPKEPSVRAKWFAFCNIGKEYHSSMHSLRLCEKHFKEDQICKKNTPNGRTKLKKYVEPSRNRECLRIIRKEGGDSQQCQICASSGLLKSQRSNSGLKISHFSFPKDSALREKWLKFCELEEEELPPVPKLCSLHFHPDKIMKYSPFKWGLAAGAVPIIYDVENIAHCGNDNCIEQSFESAGQDHDVVVEPPILVNGSYVEDDIEFVDCSIESPSCSAQNDIEDLVDEIVIDDNTSTKSDSPSPTSTKSPKRKCNRTIRYLGDVRSQDFKSPEKSKRIYEIATATINKYRKRSILLQKKVGWLQKRVRVYRQIISDLNKRLLISEKRSRLTA